ncbi:MAG: hypothetical protein HQK76_07060 [Desulfobacterales bacterium]|nr:hypothetical protein [Desulfobacterales bacterium]
MSLKKISILFFFFSVMLVVFIVCSVNVAVSSESIVKNYIVSTQLSSKLIEVSLDYIAINDTTDIFNIRDNMLSGVSSEYQSQNLGDLTGFSFIANLELSKKILINSSFFLRSFEYGYNTTTVNSMGLYIKQNLSNTDNAFMSTSVDYGLNFNISADQFLKSNNEINLLIGRFSSNVKIRIEETYIWFDKIGADYSISYGVPKSEKPPPYISNENMQDLSIYIRFITGKEFKLCFPNIFIELGKTYITYEIHSNIPDYMPDMGSIDIPKIPMNLGRNEEYLKVGSSISVNLPFNFLAYLEYDYIKFFRESELRYIDYNYIVKADINYIFRKKIVFRIGGNYYHRHLNGIIPFLYNKYTQTTFDHRYGTIHAGITVFYDLK